MNLRKSQLGQMNVAPLSNLISTPIIKVRSCNTELATENSAESSSGKNRQMTFANQGNDDATCKKKKKVTANKWPVPTLSVHTGYHITMVVHLNTREWA
jgi:hypothetical protein